VKSYLRRPLGIAALAIVLVFLVLAVAAPLLATVPNPDRFQNQEPNVVLSGRMNPMPPSFDRSQVTGFLHPLGTDSIGRDVYSELLYGARAPLLILAILIGSVLAAGLATWFVATLLSDLRGPVATVIGGVSSVLSDFIIAAPIFVVFLAWTYPDRAQIAFVYSVVIAVPLLVFACTFRAVRLKLPQIQRWNSSERSPMATGSKMGAVLTGAMGSILYVGKFVVMFGFLTIIALQFFVSSLDFPLATSWASMTERAFDMAAWARGAWWTIVPQAILLSLLTAAAYKILDTLEQVWVLRYGRL